MNILVYMLFLFCIVGNFYDVDLGLVETSVVLENLLMFCMMFEGEVGVKVLM